MDLWSGQFDAKSGTVSTLSTFCEGLNFYFYPQSVIIERRIINRMSHSIQYTHTISIQNLIINSSLAMLAATYVEVVYRQTGSVRPVLFIQCFSTSSTYGASSPLLKTTSNRDSLSRSFSSPRSYVTQSLSPFLFSSGEAFCVNPRLLARFSVCACECVVSHGGLWGFDKITPAGLFIHWVLVFCVGNFLGRWRATRVCAWRADGCGCGCGCGSGGLMLQNNTLSGLLSGLSTGNDKPLSFFSPFFGVEVYQLAWYVVVLLSCLVRGVYLLSTLCMHRMKSSMQISPFANFLSLFSPKVHPFSSSYFSPFFLRKVTRIFSIALPWFSVITHPHTGVYEGSYQVASNCAQLNMPLGQYPFTCLSRGLSYTLFGQRCVLIGQASKKKNGRVEWCNATNRHSANQTGATLLMLFSHTQHFTLAVIFLSFLQALRILFLNQIALFLSAYFGFVLVRWIGPVEFYWWGGV